MAGEGGGQVDLGVRWGWGEVMGRDPMKGWSQRLGERQEGPPGVDSGRTKASSSQRAAWIREKILDDSLTELSRSGAGPPSIVTHTIPASVADFGNLRLRRTFRA